MTVSELHPVDELYLALNEVAEEASRLSSIISRVKSEDDVFYSVINLDRLACGESDYQSLIVTMGSVHEKLKAAHDTAIGISKYLEYGLEKPGIFETKIRRSLLEHLHALSEDTPFIDQASVERIQFVDELLVLQAVALPPERENHDGNSINYSEDGGADTDRPTIAMLIEASEISDSTMQKIRSAAGVSSSKGTAGSLKRYTPLEVDRLIKEVSSGPYRKPQKIVEAWSKWSSQSVFQS